MSYDDIEIIIDEDFINDADVDSVSRGTITNTFNSLLQTGWSWGEEEYHVYSMSPEALAWLKPRLNRKINNRFFYRELGVSPIARWKTIFLSKLEEILDELGPMYNIVYDGLNITDGGLSEEKSIVVNSEFPQARIKTVQEDYATDSVETQRTSTDGLSQLDAINKYRTQYLELDSQVLAALDSCFSHLPVF